MDVTLKTIGANVKVSLGEPGDKASVPASPEPTRVEKIPYRCMRCQKTLELEENTSVICSCGWRIVLKDQKKLMRAFSTE